MRPAEGLLRRGHRRYVEDFGDRFGLRAEFGLSAAPPIDSRRVPQAELLRIVQEALDNVRKHADATRRPRPRERDAEGLRASRSPTMGVASTRAEVDAEPAMVCRACEQRAELIGGQPGRRLAPAGRDPGPGRCR